MTGHKFKVGETVYFRSDKFGPAGAFKITKHMPVSDTVRDGDFRYRLKGAEHERTAMERELTKHPPVVNASVITRDAFQSQKGVQTKKAGGKPKLPKELKQAIYIRSLGLWKRGLTSDEIKRQLHQQVSEKFKALMNYYNIPTNSSNKWEELSFYLAEELGLMTVTQPKGPSPRVRSTAGNLLIQRMDEIIAKRSLSTTLEAAEVLTRRFPDDYKRLTPKTLANRYGEAKQLKGMSLSASLAECRAAVGRQLRQQRAKRKRGPSPNVLSSWEKYLTAFLRQLQAVDK
jgi:hypothetical protein